MGQNVKKKAVPKNRMMIEPDASCMTMRARRKGFIGEVRTNIGIFETDLYIFDTTSGVQNFCMNGIAYLDNKPNKKKFPNGVYRVYSLGPLGLDGQDVLSLYYGGMRQSLRYVGHKPRRYVIHDKFVFRVKYDKRTESWQYFDPTTNTFRALPFPATELCFYRNDFKSYKGELPARFATKPARQFGTPTESYGAPTNFPSPIGRVGAPQSPQQSAQRPTHRVGMPQTTPVVQQAPVQQPTPNADGLYVVVVRYEYPDGGLKGYGVIAPDGTHKKFTEGKLMQYASEGKVKNAKTVNRNGTVFLQGVGQSLEALPKKIVQRQ